MTQFGRALCELNIEILCANSSQAKGRVERMNRTLQDRLVKELRLADIGDMETGNAFLPGFMEDYNARFAIVPARSDDLHRPINLASDRLKEILCKREQRYVGSQLTFSFERQRIMLEETEVTRGLVGRYVETYAYADGRLDVRWKGHSLPYKVFDKDQRVTHAAITDDLAPKFYPVLSSLQRFLVAVVGSVAAGCGAEPFRLRSTASRRGLSV
jgi:hypothetical protein